MVLDANRAFLHADALTETCVKPPHLRDKERMLSTEERQVRHTPRSSGLAMLDLFTWQDIGQCSGQATVRVHSGMQREICTN